MQKYPTIKIDSWNLPDVHYPNMYLGFLRNSPGIKVIDYIPAKDSPTFVEYAGPFKNLKEISTFLNKHGINRKYLRL